MESQGSVFHDYAFNRGEFAAHEFEKAAAQQLEIDFQNLLVGEDEVRVCRDTTGYLLARMGFKIRQRTLNRVRDRIWNPEWQGRRSRLSWLWRQFVWPG